MAEEDKAALLAAVAQAGTAGRQAYEASQAALATQQQGAVKAALATSMPMTGEQRGAVAGIVSAPYERASTAIGQNAATSNTFMGALGANADRYLTENNRLGSQALETALAARAAGGGGGGGGKGKKPKEPDDWQDFLKDAYGGDKTEQQAGLFQDVLTDPNAPQGAGPGHTITPNYIRQSRYAQQRFGVPEGQADRLAGTPNYVIEALNALKDAKAKGVSRQTYQKYVEGAINPKYINSTASKAAKAAFQQQLDYVQSRAKADLRNVPVKAKGKGK